MTYLLDSDILSSYLDRDRATIDRVDDLMLAGVSISIVTYMETYQVTLQSPDPQASQVRHARALLGIPILPFTVEVAERCAQMRHDLSASGRKVRSRALDLMIAATALENNLVLVTRNHADYRDIPELRIL
jgi:predicted nucleic acid-binding protein